MYGEDIMKYARLYEGCIDNEPSVIYGASYNPYPAGLSDAEFPGGDVEFIVYIKNNTEIQEVYSGEYDEKGRPLLVTGEVWVEFVVDRCGLTRNFRVVQSLTDEQDAEALRVMESLPIFKAAELNGYRVKAAYIAKIPFMKSIWEEPKPDPYSYYEDGYYDSSYDSYYDGSYDSSNDPYYDGSYDSSNDPYSNNDTNQY